MTDNRQPQAETAVRSGAGGIGLSEAIKDIGKKIGGDPHPGVGDPDVNVEVGSLHLNGNAPLFRRELDGIRQKIPDDLLKPIGIGQDGDRRIGESERDRNPLGVGRRLNGLDRRLNDRGDLDLPDVEMKLPGDNPGNVEQILDQLRLSRGVSRDRLQPATRCFFIEVSPLQQLRPSQNGIQRGAKLVGDDREEFILGPICILRLPIQPGALNRQGGAPGQLLRQSEIAVLIPPARLRRNERDRADRTPLNDQRDDHGPTSPSPD